MDDLLGAIFQVLARVLLQLILGNLFKLITMLFMLPAHILRALWTGTFDIEEEDKWEIGIIALLFWMVFSVCIIFIYAIH